MYTDGLTLINMIFRGSFWCYNVLSMISKNKISIYLPKNYLMKKQETPQMNWHYLFNNIPLERGSGQSDCWPDVSIVLNHFTKISLCMYVQSHENTHDRLWQRFKKFSVKEWIPIFDKRIKIWLNINDAHCAYHQGRRVWGGGRFGVNLSLYQPGVRLCPSYYYLLPPLGFLDLPLALTAWT